MMTILLWVCLAVSMIAVLLSLGFGLHYMAQKTEEGNKKSQLMMRYRIYSQGAALLFLFIIIMTSGK
jgi:hypothetical protein